MVSIRFISFLFALMFILRNSTANIHQGKDKIAVAAWDAVNYMFYDVSTRQDSEIKGRKFMKRRVLMKEIKDKDTSNNEESKSEVEGTTDLVNINYNHKDKIFKMSSFIALNADYHPSASHPPSHN